MSEPDLQTALMPLVHGGVWLFLGFIGVQISAVIVSAFFRRNGLRRVHKQLLTAGRRTQAQLDELNHAFLCGELASRREVDAEMKRSWLARHDDIVSSPGEVLKAALWLTVCGRDEKAVAVIEDYVCQLSRDCGQFTSLGVMATQGGLLGTVFGAIDAFKKLASGSQAKDAMLSTLGALSFALWTTAIGLVMALVLRMTMHWLIHPHIRRCQRDIELAFQSLSFRVIQLQAMADESDFNAVQSTNSDNGQSHYRLPGRHHETGVEVCSYEK